MLGLRTARRLVHRPAAETGRVSYLIDDDYLRFALAQTRAAGVDLELRPFEFDEASLGRLLYLGIRWYATDYPARFVQTVCSWR